MNLYAMCGNNVINSIDYSGLRTIEFIIYHNCSDNDLPQKARDEAERIFQECFKKCDTENCHTINISWQKTTKNADNYKELKLGIKGGIFNFIGPTYIGMFVNCNNKIKKPGYNNGVYSSINPSIIREQSTNYSTGMGVAIAHEVGFHGIGGFTDIFSDQEGYVDSKNPPSSGVPVFRDDRCRKICKKLDVNS